MDRQNSFDVVFHDSALGITFTPEREDLGAVVDGFYRMGDEILEAEISGNVALNDRVIAVQGKSVEKESFKSILKRLRTKKRPIRISFERKKETSVPEISWNEVLSHSTDLSIYQGFLQRKNLYLCSMWLSYVIDIDHVLKKQGNDKSIGIERLWHEYVDEHGEYTRFMYYSSSNQGRLGLSFSEKAFYLSNMKVEMRDRIIRLSWNSFVQSPELNYVVYFIVDTSCYD